MLMCHINSDSSWLKNKSGSYIYYIGHIILWKTYYSNLNIKFLVIYKKKTSIVWIDGVILLLDILGEVVATFVCKGRVENVWTYCNG